MDTILFNEERRHHRHQEIVKDDFWLSVPDKSQKTVVDIAGLLDEIENEILYDIIKNSDEDTKKIIELKYQGYFVWEIAKMTNLTIEQINYRIKKIRSIFKKLQK